jgi:DNA-binding NtrC family response regulator
VSSTLITSTTDQKEPQRILLVDDNPTNLQVLFQTLEGRGYKLLIAKSGEDALKIARKAQPHLVLLDIMMPGMDGYETCRKLKEDPETRESAVIFLSALDDTKDKVRGLEQGAVDFITKPFQGEEVLARVDTHLTIQRLKAGLQARNDALEHELKVAQDFLKDARERVDGPLLGDSPAVRRFREEIDACAANCDMVLLTGPPGAGQEAVARAIHHDSSRGKRPFIYLNCTGFQSGTQTLFRLSGEQVGANPKFKGGKFELALGGTLYLEGIDRLPPQAQTEVVEMIEQSGRDGSGRQPEFDVRIIASTSRPMDEIRDSPIEPNLYQMLVKRQLRVPALVERREDIPALVEHFVKTHARAIGKVVERVSDESLERLQEYGWPGNIRELQNVIERVVVTATEPVLEVEAALLEEGIPLGSYRLVERLGTGAMGEVWLAKHQFLARPAAVKLIRQDALGDGENDEVFLKRFQREAQATAHLHSPHTVQLYDFGVTETGTFYYVMERLNGMDLENIVSKFGPLPSERAVWFLRQACRSLSEAHEAGMVHRDIKPANLYACRLGPDYDFLKVLDFGMVTAPVDDQRTRLTQAGTSQGTPAYMPPEIAIGEAEVDGRADIYAIGCVAHWMLTGGLVFEADSAMAMMLHHVQTPPVAASTLSEQEIPEALDRVILSCLEKKPGDRPASADELWKRLGEIEFSDPWSHQHAQQWWQLHLPQL